MSTGGSGPTGDTAIRYQSEMPEIMARKLGLMDQAVNLAKTGQAGSYNPTLPTQQVAGFTGQQQDAFFKSLSILCYARNRRSIC